MKNFPKKSRLWEGAKRLILKGFRGAKGAFWGAVEMFFTKVIDKLLTFLLA